MNTKILVVDDDSNICDLLRLYLEKEGYSVVLAHNGKDALTLFNLESPSMILLDIMLPLLDGWQVCREIRKESNVPIIMITAKGETFDTVLGLELQKRFWRELRQFCVVLAPVKNLISKRLPTINLKLISQTMNLL